MVVFEKCDVLKRPKGAKCKSDSQIEEWMLFKYILTLENEANFIQHKFGENRIERKAQVRSYALNYSTRSDYVKMIYRSEVHFSDSIMNVSGFLDEEETGYFVEREAIRLLPYKNNFLNSITYEMSVNKRDYVRQVDTILDLFGDIGGLMGALTMFCYMIISCLQNESSY